MIEALIISLLLAFTNRVRGGLFGDAIRTKIPFYGTTLGRLIFSISVAGSTLILGGSLLLAALAIGTVFLGHAIAPFAPFQFMERSNDLLIMSLRGVILTGATGILLMTMGHVLGGGLFVLGGLLMGPIYKLARLLPVVPLFSDNPATMDKNETAEVLFGFVTGLLLILALYI